MILEIENIVILNALSLAANAHRNQRRKDKAGTPYINHPIEVARLLAVVGRITDSVVLSAALLHDSIEDTNILEDEIARVCSADTLGVVREVTDDKSMPYEDRKRLQILHAPHLTSAAKLVKLADKIHNLTETDMDSPHGWSLSRRVEYVEWSVKVVAGCRGVNKDLEDLFDKVVQDKRKLFAAFEI